MSKWSERNYCQSNGKGYPIFQSARIITLLIIPSFEINTNADSGFHFGKNARTLSMELQ